MPPNHIAQTSTEVKKAYKKNGIAISERTHRQLERGHELEERAAREREAEKRRKAAKDRRAEKERKEKAVRQQLGVGLATQLIGYSHTQANLKKGMEAFLGVNKKKQDDEARRRETAKRREDELTNTLEVIAQEIEKEPFDDEDLDDVMWELPCLDEPAGERWDEDLDDVTLLEVHDLITSDPVEAALSDLPGAVIELLSQDAPTPSSDWIPAQSLLHKFNPIGLPPHRLRIKVGCVLVCLRDLNTSSQLSKSQHVRVLRAENDRLDCLTLDGQLAGTKTVITRTPFPARYQNDEKFPFTRTQYPVRIATDYTAPHSSRETVPIAFKLPSIYGRPRSSLPTKRVGPPSVRARVRTSSNPTFKLPGLPASKVQPAGFPRPPVPVSTTVSNLHTLDEWDDFLESGTQIARELSAEPTNNTPQPPPLTESLPPLSTQDLDFSLDDLDDEPQILPALLRPPTTTKSMHTSPAKMSRLPPTVRPGPLSRTAHIRRIDLKSEHMPPPPPLARPQKPSQVTTKRQMMEPPPRPSLPAKKLCLPSPQRARVSAVASTSSKSYDDFGMSTQDASSFFDDDDDWAFGSPPIAV